MKTLTKKILISSSLALVSAGGVAAYLATALPKEFIPVYRNSNSDIEISKKASHYFVIMMDSMASYKVESVLEQEDLEEQFNGWDLKMNVLSPGYGTETGLSGVIGGPKRTAVIGQFKGIKTPQTFNDAWDNMVSDVSTADVENIYISNPEYYNTSGRHSVGTRTIKDEMHKVVYLDSSHEENSEPDSLAMLAHQVNANENNFSFFVSDIGHTNGYSNAYFNKAGGGIINQILNLKKELKRRKMYDNSYILIASDHGRSQIGGKAYTGKYFNQLTKIKYDYYMKYNPAYVPNIWNPAANSIDSISNPTFEAPVSKGYKEGIIGGGEAVVASMASIFYKPRHQTNNKIHYDEQNLFADYDVPGIFYNDLKIDDKNISFNLNDYMPKTYNGSSYNSYVKNPLRADLTNRKLFVMNKNNNWGIFPNLLFGKQVSLYKGPFLKPSNKIEKYILDDIQWTWRETPIIEKEANKALKTDKDGGLKTLGILLNALESNKKIHY